MTYEALNGKAPAPHAALFHNNHDGTFTNVAEKAGVANDRWGFGVAVGDYDNDGWPDLYVTNFGKNRLYHNNHDGTLPMSPNKQESRSAHGPQAPPSVTTTETEGSTSSFPATSPTTSAISCRGYEGMGFANFAQFRGVSVFAVLGGSRESTTTSSTTTATAPLPT